MHIINVACHAQSHTQSHATTPGITERLDPKQFAMAGIATQHAIVYLLHLTLEALHRGNCWARKFFADFKKRFRPCVPSYPIR